MATTKRLSREESLKSAAFKTAFSVAVKKYPKRRCAHGHDLTKPENVHVGDLLRTGHLTCNTCWEKSQARYMKRAAKKRAA